MSPEQASSGDSSTLRILETGPVTVVDFGTEPIPNDAQVAEHVAYLLLVIRENDCRVLAFELAGVQFMPSGMLGLLASLGKHVEEIHLRNASEYVRQAVEIAHLNRLVTLKFLDRPSRSC